VKAHQSVFVTRSVNRHDLLESEIPFQLRFNERSHKSTASSIDVDDRVNILLD
jgi:hypothetical protein